jgi:hypothetical protein
MCHYAPAVNSQGSRAPAPGSEPRRLTPPVRMHDSTWYHFGIDCYVKCVQIVHGWGRIGGSGRSRTHRHPDPFGGGRKVVGSNPAAPINRIHEHAPTSLAKAPKLRPSQVREGRGRVGLDAEQRNRIALV